MMRYSWFILCLFVFLPLASFGASTLATDTIPGLKIYHQSRRAERFIFIGQEMYIQLRNSNLVFRGFLTNVTDSTITLYNQQYFTFRYSNLRKVGKYNTPILLRNVYGYGLLGLGGTIATISGVIPPSTLRMKEILATIFFIGISIAIYGLILLFAIKRARFRLDKGWRIKAMTQRDAMHRRTPVWDIVLRVLAYIHNPYLALHELRVLMTKPPRR